MLLDRCWAFDKLWNNKFYYKVASGSLFLLIHTTMDGSMNIKKKSINLAVRTVWMRRKDKISYQIICCRFQFYLTMLTRFQFTSKVMWYTDIYRVIREKNSGFSEVISTWTCVFFWMVRAAWISRANSTTFFFFFMFWWTTTFTPRR
jgi:hypothetical protein